MCSLPQVAELGSLLEKTKGEKERMVAELSAELSSTRQNSYPDNLTFFAYIA